MEFNKVYLINDSDLETLLSFAESTERCIEEGRIDLALEGIAKFKTTIKNRMKER